MVRAPVLRRSFTLGPRVDAVRCALVTGGPYVRHKCGNPTFCTPGERGFPWGPHGNRVPRPFFLKKKGLFKASSPQKGTQTVSRLKPRFPSFPPSLDFPGESPRKGFCLEAEPRFYPWKLCFGAVTRHTGLYQLVKILPVAVSDTTDAQPPVAHGICTDACDSCLGPDNVLVRNENVRNFYRYWCEVAGSVLFRNFLFPSEVPWSISTIWKALASLNMPPNLI